ncbi:hypothetical protein [Streptomyces asiaticus]
MTTSPRWSVHGRRPFATTLKRAEQAVSEWYVLQMLELSWDGFIEHVSQGWNVGKPPYGYRAEKVPHPVPARRAEGRTKHRLVRMRPEPRLSPTSSSSADWTSSDTTPSPTA